MTLLPYRVLDLTNDRGQPAGQTLADLGAEVILVEPPGGSTSRQLGPFVEGAEGDPEQSLWFWSYNRGKRSVTVDIDTDEGREAVTRLAATADVVIESDSPGAMAARGLGYEQLSADNPGLVYTSISPFGQTGPKANWAATDLTLVGAGMQLTLMGDADRPPVRIPFDQASLHGSAEAAAATLIALYDRNRSGLGQHVDVSIQQAVTQATQSTSLSHHYNAPQGTRMSGGAKLGPFEVILRSPAADGYVSTTILFGTAIGPFGKRLFDWIHAEGECEDSDLEIDWIDFVDGVQTGRIPLDEYRRIQEVAAKFTSTRTKAYLQDEALKRRLLMVPVSTVGDVAESDQYRDRDFWREIDVPILGRSVRFPGPFAKFGATPMQIDRPAPAVGADNEAVLADSAADGAADGPSDGAAGGSPVAPTAPAVPTADADRGPGTGALSGLKILDFMWVMAGPAATRMLADNGAQVIRIESANKVEAARTIQPFLNDEGGVENSGLFQNMNAGKMSISLDMSKPESIGVVHDLVQWADVVCESFSPKAMKGWGIGYEDLKAIKPDLIMTSSCLFGQSGPLSSLAGFGTMGASLSGFYTSTGWPDREPAGCFGAYTDYISPRFLAAAILAAVDHRDRTGEGQYIDLSQAEASISFLAPALLDYVVNGREAERPGNRHPTMAPHGVFPVAGDDRWIAIACQNDEQWKALCAEAGFDSAVADRDQQARKASEDELEAMIAAWSADHDGLALQDRLQAAGVACHISATSTDLAEDPQLIHRGHFVAGEHAENGTMHVEGSRFKLSRTPSKITSAGPTIGQHTFDVLLEVLGYDDEKLSELVVAEALE
jgi:crotonobetainyl-CoA:carnitine CoA-transferase CaiB-like acyl-CoA transferase